MVLGASTEAGGMELSDDKTLLEAGLIDRTEITLHKFTVSIPNDNHD